MVKKIDCHMHVHGGVRSWGWEDDQRLIDAADRLGIDQMVCSIPATGGRSPADRVAAAPDVMSENNDGVLRAMRRFPGRLLGYCYVNPGYGRAALEEMERCVVGEGMVGVKLYIDEIGSSFVEVLAIGTAARRHPEAHTHSEQLPPQAIIRDRDTFFDATGHGAAKVLERK